MTVTMYSLEESVLVSTIVSTCNVLLHILLGMIVGVALLFAVKLNFNVDSVPEDIILLHILLCVPGYTLLMSQSLLSMTTYNTWSSKLSIKTKRRVHWVIQTIASALAVTGSIIMMVYKDVNFNTLHGKFGLVALVFTLVSIMVGVAALFSNKLQRIVPPIAIKITHIVLGIVSYSSAAVCLCLAFNKTIFRNWTSDNVSLGVILINCFFTCLILINPFVNLCKKFVKIIKVRLEK